MTLRSYSGNAKRTALTGDITASSMTFTVSDATGYPSPSAGQGPFVVTLNLGLTGEEKLTITSRSGNTFMVGERGFDGTAPAMHKAGATVDHTLSAADIREVNEFVNSGGTITTASAGAKGLVVKGSLGQAGNAFEYQNSAGALSAAVGPAGTISAGGQLQAGFLEAIIPAGSTGARGLFVRGAAGQTANLAEFQNNTGKVQFSVNQFGALRVSGNVATELNEGWASIAISSGDQKGLLVRGSAGQAANLAEFQSVTGNVLAGVSPVGRYLFNSVNTQTVVGPAGGAQALPATPTGYLTITDQGGINRVVPFYNA